MSSASNEKSNAFSADRLDEATTECLMEAAGMAQFTRFPSIHASHIALVLLSGEESFLDPLLRTHLDGLQAATVSESLLDILEIEADLSEVETESLSVEGLPEERHFDSQAMDVLRRAGEIADERGLQTITLRTLALALFENPERFLLEAFQDAGKAASELEAFAKTLTPDESDKTESDCAPEPFLEDDLNFAAFGLITQAALRVMAHLANDDADRKLRDDDLLNVLLHQEFSLLAEALHVMSISVPVVRRHLEQRTSSMPASIVETALNQNQMTRLLNRIFHNAGKLAAQEGCQMISESHLIRAHIDLIAEGTNNLYSRFGIDTSRLKRYLSNYNADRIPEDPKKTAQEPSRMVEDFEGYLYSRIINQEHAIRTILPALTRMRSGLRKRGRTLGKFLFFGPTGVGKTELTRAIADVAFGPKPGVRDPYLLTIDCGNFKNHWDIVQLLGAAQGLKGYKEGQLTNGLRDKPRSVILFDEAEKAHPDVWQSLLPLFDKGIVREADGTEHDATGCIFIATSNEGYKDAINQFDLYNKSAKERMAVQEQIEEFILMRVKEKFSPELLGRFGRENMIFFNHFDKSNYLSMIEMQVDRLIREMKEDNGIDVSVDESVLNLLADFAWERREEGARPVERLVTSHIADQLDVAHMKDPDRTLFSFTTLQGSGQVILEN